MFQLRHLVQCAGEEHGSASYPAYSISGTQREDFPLNSYEDNLLSQVGTWAYQSLSVEVRGWSATQFLSMLLYVNVCLPDNVLDPVDPRLEFSTLEYGRHRGMWTREAETWSTNFTRY